MRCPCGSHPALQLGSLDDPEDDYASVTLAAERRRLLASSAAAFTVPGTPSGPQGPLSAAAASAQRQRGAGGAARRPTSSAGAAADTGSVFAPAAAANFRANLLRSGGLTDEQLRRIQVPTLLLASARDRMLPSLVEGAPCIYADMHMHLPWGVVDGNRSRGGGGGGRNGEWQRHLLAGQDVLHCHSPMLR